MQVPPPHTHTHTTQAHTSSCSHVLMPCLWGPTPHHAHLVMSMTGSLAEKLMAAAAGLKGVFSAASIRAWPVGGGRAGGAYWGGYWPPGGAYWGGAPPDKQRSGVGRGGLVMH